LQKLLHYIYFHPLFQYSLGKPIAESRTILDSNQARDDGVAVTLAGPYANHLHFASDR